jgi:hypothetical protein
MSKEMVFIEPWKTVIGKINISDRADMEMLAGEIFSIVTEWDTSIADNPGITEEDTPLIIHLRDEIIGPIARQFAIDSMDYDPGVMRCHTKGLTLVEGPGLGAHYHTNANLSTILYTGESDAKLLLLDPRNNACRGYPREIRNKHFANYIIYPKPGDLYLVPSYIAHEVTAVFGDIRASLINDFYFDKY